VAAPQCGAEFQLFSLRTSLVALPGESA